MEGKLYKTNNNTYILVDPTKGTYDDGYMLGTSRESQYNKLSIKNCETIERGYDLDELAMGYDLYENINFVGQTRAYKAGFQKALSILGDKKFSDEQLRTAYNVGYTDGKDGATFYNRFIQSLQQTEWDVEIVMETCQVMVQHGDMEFQDFPKLDADGCIILKRK